MNKGKLEFKSKYAEDESDSDAEETVVKKKTTEKVCETGTIVPSVTLLIKSTLQRNKTVLTSNEVNND